MLDVTSTNQLSAVAANRRLDVVAPAKANPASGGQNTPASGTTLPADRPARSEPIELPELERLTESISQFVRSMNRDLTFSVHEASGQMVVQVLDGETKEVIKQIPSEEFLRMSEALANGSALLLDTEA
jgi:flagellar protein FlaG